MWKRGEDAGRKGKGTKQGKKEKEPNTYSYEIRTTVVDHVVNHGLTMAEAGRRVQPNVGRTTVNSIIHTFHRENRCV